ncbi:HNH endonuclease signature motif containing protein [Microbacterium sp. 10M-3C3]|uniref:HNH endonuclease signature motif containing protein n=1 Tax=Microbacterium sp. 10M-3C3 TaxID=2483401 RepID=UPI0013DDFD91|nr:HNH endonuclease signature motif containing protein [Microbacterium sp. 10M-3C3]
MSDEHGRMRQEVDAAVAARVALARAQAELIRHHARVAELAYAQTAQIVSRSSRERDMPMRSVAAELGAAAHQHDMTVQKELSDAYDLVHRFAATVNALAHGTISMRHVSVIRDAGHRLPDEVRGAWESVVLDYAATTTPGRTKAYAGQLAEKLDPTGMTERFDTANGDREVSVHDLADGMALLQMLLPATLAHGAKDRLRRMATQTKNAANDHARDGGVEDARTVRQIEADIAADLLLTATPTIDPTTDRSPGGLGAIRAVVQIVVPVTTLTGTTDAGAMLNGHTPIDPATAKKLAGDAPGWDRIMCHPVTGTVLATDRYTPTTEQVRFLRARDQHCRMPGCRQPAVRCHIDHNHEHQHGGRTHIGNLSHLCIRHHTLKTETEWAVEQSTGGVLHFTSPLGRRYREAPPPRVMFVPDDEPPPF